MCTVARPPDGSKDNARFEDYDPLMMDSSLFGYKVFAVSYGGSLKLFGKKGVQNPQEPAAAAACPVPSPDKQTDVQEWAKLSGNSWGLLASDLWPFLPILSLDRNVDWQAGDRVVVATTDWYASHSEVATVQFPLSASTFLLQNLPSSRTRAKPFPLHQADPVTPI